MPILRRRRNAFVETLNVRYILYNIPRRTFNERVLISKRLIWFLCSHRKKIHKTV